jgi:hypothetical protein
MLQDTVFYHSYGYKTESVDCFNSGTRQVAVLLEHISGDKYALPGYDRDEFPICIGLNDSCTDIYLFNTQTWHS